MDAESLKNACADLSLGPIRYFDSIDSTNNEAARWLELEATHMSLVVADEQTAGRGRKGRTWFTPRGAALAFSLILTTPSHGRAKLTAQGLTARLTGLGALAVSMALSQDFNLFAQIKWPNDVLLEGKKVAGILTEAQWQGQDLRAVILGVGVNIYNSSIPPADNLILPATCVQTHLDRPVTRISILHAILARLQDWYQRLDQADFLNAWEQNLAYSGSWVNLFGGEDQTNPVYTGQVIGLDSNGQLKLRDHLGQIKKVHSGEIRLRPIEQIQQ
jgi:BirA family biotin operon repressor/biotin-[acetyl-CoA-carboxylase] ligase